MGIKDSKQQTKPSYPYVGVGKYSKTKVLFTEPDCGYIIETGDKGRDVGLFSDNWAENGFTPIVHTVTFDLS